MKYLRSLKATFNTLRAHFLLVLLLSFRMLALYM